MAKLTKLTKKNFLDAYKINESVINSCEVIGISRAAIYKELEKDLKFKEELEEIKDKHNEELIKLAKKGLKYNLGRNFQSAIEYTLNNKCKGEYANTSKTEVSGPGGTSINYTIKLAYPEKKDAQD